MMTGEMSPYEGVLATQWLGLETVLPCHYITLDGDHDVAEDMKHHREVKARGDRIADPYLLKSGEWIEFDAAGKVLRPAAAAA
jgi:L-ascorbate metabolism protein UlaG (beta-lactamase superfamily)